MRSLSSIPKPSKPALAIGGAVVLVGVGVALAVNSGAFDSSSEATTVAAPDASKNHSVTPVPPLAPGNYLFDVVGGLPSPVIIEATGSEAVTMIRPINENNPDEFRVTLNRKGNTYTGEVNNPVGVVCQSDGQPHPAQNKYTMQADGSDGLVEVLGEPCGPGVPNVPLKFDLVRG